MPMVILAIGVAAVGIPTERWVGEQNGLSPRRWIQGVEGYTKFCCYFEKYYRKNQASGEDSEDI